MDDCLSDSQKKRFPSPRLVSKFLVLDADGSKYEFCYFEHPMFRHFLCMSSCHLGKSWKHHISKLGLSKIDARKLLCVLYRFALTTTICDGEELDLRMKSIILFAMKLCGLEPNQDHAALPSHVRFGNDSCSQSVHGLTEEEIRPDVAEMLEHLCDEIESESDEDVPSGERLSQEMDKMCRAYLDKGQKSGGNQEILSKIRSMQNKKEMGGKSKPLVTTLFVAEVMHSIFASADLWLQAIACQGFTMGRKSSAWSESMNSAIRRHIERLDDGTLSLDEVILKIMDWSKGLCEKSFSFYQAPASMSTVKNINPKHVDVLNKFVSVFAVSEIDKILGESEDICTFQAGNWVGRDDHPAYRKKLDFILERYGIEWCEVRFCRPQKRAPSAPTSYPRESDRAEKLSACSCAVNFHEPSPAVAIYFPAAQSKCKIPFLDDPDMLSDGIVLMCPCQKQNAAGLPCHHICQYVFRSATRYIKNLVWLCNPFFIRGHEIEESLAVVAEQSVDTSPVVISTQSAAKKTRFRSKGVAHFPVLQDDLEISREKSDLTRSIPLNDCGQDGPSTVLRPVLLCAFFYCSSVLTQKSPLTRLKSLVRSVLHRILLR